MPWLMSLCLISCSSYVCMFTFYIFMLYVFISYQCESFPGEGDQVFSCTKILSLGFCSEGRGRGGEIKFLS